MTPDSMRRFKTYMDQHPVPNLGWMDFSGPQIYYEGDENV